MYGIPYIHRVCHPSGYGTNHAGVPYISGVLEFSAHGEKHESFLANMEVVWSYQLERSRTCVRAGASHLGHLYGKLCKQSAWIRFVQTVSKT